MGNIVKNENINWNLPCLAGETVQFLDNIVSSIDTIEQLRPIKYVHGSIYNKWNGEERALYKNINDFIFPKCVINRIVTPVVTFSAYNITDEDLRDRNANILLDMIMEVDGEVEVSSDKLYEYIKSRYPNARTVASPIKSLFELEQGNEVDFYNRLTDRYNRVVLSSNYVKTSFLNDADKIRNHSKFEIIVNDRCIKNCPLAIEHENSIENDLSFDKCPKKDMGIRDLCNNTLALSEIEIDNIIKNTDIKNFRIKGRENKSEDIKFLVASYILKKFGVNSYFVYTMG